MSETAEAAVLDLVRSGPMSAGTLWQQMSELDHQAVVSAIHRLLDRGLVHFDKDMRLVAGNLSQVAAFTPLPLPLSIIAAAIRVEGRGVMALSPPARHHDLIQQADALGLNGCVSGDDQGFMASDGRYVTRREAWMIADAASQINRQGGGPDGVLFSEDLW